MNRPLPYRKDDAVGFSLMELMVSMAIILLVLLVLVSTVDSTRRTWTFTTAKIEQFRDARNAFEAITKRLSQATMNTYWDYVDANGNFRSGSSFVPARYVRQSELRFISGPSLTGDASKPTHAIFFQAPLGVTSGTAYANLATALNTVGYYLEFESDKDQRPACILNAQPNHFDYRFRLKEMIEPTESLTLYQYTSGSGNSSYKGAEWYMTPMGTNTTGTSWSRVMADNIVALVFLPKLSTEEDSTGTKLCPNYTYDSTLTNADPLINPKNQLPPVVQVTMVAIDEESAARLAGMNGNAMPDLGLETLFQDASKYQADLDQLQANLLRRTYSNNGNTYSPAVKLPTAVNYRIFTTNVPIRTAKWSVEEAN
ncbi:MAG: Verru_Chthon cassette protein C [Chthoniobacteraceae bacterium]